MFQRSGFSEDFPSSHTNHNQNKKAHKNGIRKPTSTRSRSLKGVRCLHWVIRLIIDFLSLGWCQGMKIPLTTSKIASLTMIQFRRNARFALIGSVCPLLFSIDAFRMLNFAKEQGPFGSQASCVIMERCLAPLCLRHVSFRSLPISALVPAHIHYHPVQRRRNIFSIHTEFKKEYVFDL